MKKYLAAILTPLAGLIFFILFGFNRQEKEKTEYNGVKLTPLHEQRTTTIESPPRVDLKKYKLKISGKVQKPLEFKYEEVLALPHQSRVITMNCVEGWSYKALWTGIRITDLIAKAQPDPAAKTVIFYAIGGDYSSSLPLQTIAERNILLAFKINGVTLPAGRGFPFMVAAEDKFGYKWVQWVERIELSDKDYAGFWEKRGYSNNADIKK